MHDLSPILNDMADYTGFLQSLYNASHAATAKQQADALMPVWQAIEKSDTKSNKLTTTALHDMFTHIARYLNVVQLQRPLIAPYSHHLSAQLNMVMRKTMPDDMYNSTKITSYGDFGTAKILPNRKYKFTFLRARQNNTHLSVIPVIMIDPDIMAQTVEHGGRDLLQTFQSLTDISNHDYIHAATAPIINAYYGEGALHLEHTPYMQAHKTQNPLRTLYPKNETSWQVCKQSPMALAAYDFTTPLEGHALLAHKALFTKYLDQSPTAILIDTYFDQLSTLMTKVDAPIAHEIGQYYTLMLYHRMLHMLPFTHPVMQHIEQRGAALPIPHDDWQSTYTHLINPENATTQARKDQLKIMPIRIRTHTKLSGSGSTHEQSASQLIRMCAHVNGMQYWTPLHYAPHKDAKQALPDLHRVLRTTSDELQSVHQTLKIA